MICYFCKQSMDWGTRRVVFAGQKEKWKVGYFCHCGYYRASKDPWTEIVSDLQSEEEPHGR
tara:strand:- start:791 stop:973 length:183 start_codon:yes stop_codon:yes gene_type:complete